MICSSSASTPSPMSVSRRSRLPRINSITTPGTADGWLKRCTPRPSISCFTWAITRSPPSRMVTIRAEFHQVDQHRLVAAVRGRPGGPHQIAVELLEHAGAVAARGIGRHDITGSPGSPGTVPLQDHAPHRSAHRSRRTECPATARPDLAGVRTGGVTIEDRCLHADAV